MSQEKLIPADQTKCAELARFVVRTTFEDLPEAIAQKAVRHISIPSEPARPAPLHRKRRSSRRRFMPLGKAAAPLRFGGAAKK